MGRRSHRRSVRQTDRRAATSQCVEEISTIEYKPDPETGVAPGFTRCRNMRSRCRCSMCPAIHINSRSWLRSSSTHEPSDPPLRVVKPPPKAATISFQTPRGAGSRSESLRPSPKCNSEDSRYEKQRVVQGGPSFQTRVGLPYSNGTSSLSLCEDASPAVRCSASRTPPRGPG